jgi:hypothetical protein
VCKFSCYIGINRQYISRNVRTVPNSMLELSVITSAFMLGCFIMKSRYVTIIIQCIAISQDLPRRYLYRSSLGAQLRKTTSRGLRLDHLPAPVECEFCYPIWEAPCRVRAGLEKKQEIVSCFSKYNMDRSKSKLLLCRFFVQSFCNLPAHAFDAPEGAEHARLRSTVETFCSTDQPPILKKAEHIFLYIGLTPEKGYGNTFVCAVHDNS